ncbi:MAG TPA: hypothetical protein VES73_16925 [Lamprocystis sp. (in: g-proteobacteria)]|nr:hypothetical protein [Lamprocystis sp. (in: g-proteobacteria)]
MKIRSLSVGTLAAALLLAAPVTNVWAAHRADAQQAITRALAAHEQAVAAGVAGDTAALIKRAQDLLPSRGYSKAIELANQARKQDESAVAKAQAIAADAQRPQPVSPLPASVAVPPEAPLAPLAPLAPATPPVPQPPPAAPTVAAPVTPALAPPAPVPAAYPPQLAAATPNRTPVAAASPERAVNKFNATEAEAAIATAEAARKKADTVGGEWRDTAQMIKDAGDLVKSGQFDAAVKLANKARRQGELGYDQAIGEQTASFPSYMLQKTP